MRGPVAVGLSGGVDSAVSALLLLRAGYSVEGLHMTNWEEDEEGYCSAARDLEDARLVAAELGIPLHPVNFAAEYRERVFAHFLAEYRAGRTPNPDILCNREVKFGVCLDYARRLGLPLLATGHYAGLGPGPVLLRGADRAKDQSYFLCDVPGAALAAAAFPLAGLEKAEVRQLAREAGLPVHAKRDSTGICFIGERPFREFLARFLPARPGRIETLDGTDLGQHAGLWHYTIGQRRGIELGGLPDRPESAWYVAGKDLERNVLIVVQGHDHPALYAASLITGTPNWIGPPPDLPFACTAKVRYRQTDVPATLEAAPGGLAVSLQTPTYAVTPGQQTVFYDGERCLGGAVIVATGTATLAARADRGERAGNRRAV
jgi:tRNA-uridine 2-sulfurtransferase